MVDALPEPAPAAPMRASPSSPPRFLIIGAGPAGLGAATRLHQLGVCNTVVVDPYVNTAAGGICRTGRGPRGFLYDTGCHVVFSHYRYFDAVLDSLRLDWTHSVRNAWCYCRGTWVPFPFQTNFHALRHVRDVLSCVLGLVEVARGAAVPPRLYVPARLRCVPGVSPSSALELPYTAEPCESHGDAEAVNAAVRAYCLHKLQDRVGKEQGTFYHHVYSRYGAGIASVFLAVYNEKVWAYPLLLLSSTWVGERVAPVDVPRVLASVCNSRMRDLPDLRSEASDPTGRRGPDVASSPACDQPLAPAASSAVDSSSQSNVEETPVPVRPGWGPHSTFRFPTKGCTGLIYETLVERFSSASSSSPVTFVQGRLHHMDCDRGVAYVERGGCASGDGDFTGIVDHTGRVVPADPSTSADVKPSLQSNTDGTTESDGLLEVPFTAVISTMPIDQLLAKNVLVSSAFDDAVSWSVRKSVITGLIKSGVVAVGIAVRGTRAHNMNRAQSSSANEGPGPFMSWMYFPDMDAPFYRACFPSQLSPHSVPDDLYGSACSILCEVSYSECRPLESDNLADVVSSCINGCRAVGLLSENDDILEVWARHIPYGYPTPHVGRDILLNSVQGALARIGVRCRGRFGGWKYEVGNQDHSFMQGVEAVDAFLFGSDEPTYLKPDYVNGRQNVELQFDHAWS